jgi:hypothetical protein
LSAFHRAEIHRVAQERLRSGNAGSPLEFCRFLVPADLPEQISIVRSTREDVRMIGRNRLLDVR